MPDNPHVDGVLVVAFAQISSVADLLEWIDRQKYTGSILVHCAQGRIIGSDKPQEPDRARFTGDRDRRRAQRRSEARGGEDRRRG